MITSWLDHGSIWIELVCPPLVKFTSLTIRSLVHQCLPSSGSLSCIAKVVKPYILKEVEDEFEFEGNTKSAYRTNFLLPPQRFYCVAIFKALD